MAVIKSGSSTDQADVTVAKALKTDSSAVTQPVSVDRSNRTVILRTNTIVTTAVTADQVVLTYTVTIGKTLWLAYYAYDTRLTVLSATASILGTMSLELPSGTKGFTSSETNPTTSQTAMRILNFSEPIPVTSGTTVRVVCTPAAVTSMTWIGNLGGYEL